MRGRETECALLCLLLSQLPLPSSGFGRTWTQTWALPGHSGAWSHAHFPQGIQLRCPKFRDDLCGTEEDLALWERVRVKSRGAPGELLIPTLQGNAPLWENYCPHGCPWRGWGGRGVVVAVASGELERKQRSSLGLGGFLGTSGDRRATGNPRAGHMAFLSKAQQMERERAGGQV